MLNPLPASKWNATTAAHLLNRAGFGGPPSEIAKLVEMGPDRAVSHFVDYERVADTSPKPVWAEPDATRLERFAKMRSASPEQRKEMQREEQQRQRQRLLDLRQWWLQRMATGPRPLQEKLTLFWHGHFATSVQKVKDPYLMWLQNDTFRRHASGNWLEMLTAVSKDPAMLIWLDQAQSRKEHPNENFAREVMELFALGEGHYTEKDVTEAARALTGWSLDRVSQEFVYRPRLHDDDSKIVLGRVGNLRGEDVLEQIVAQPQAARLITAKLWSFFGSENPVEPFVNGLADVFRKSGNNFKPLLRAMFRCEEFYLPSVIRNQVKSPVQWLVSATRMLERELPSPMISSNMLRLLGQDLFAPPNVKGWDGGLSWITTNNLLNRYNLAELLVLGDNPLAMAPGRPKGKGPRNRPMDPTHLMKPVEVKNLLKEDQRHSKEQVIAALQARFLQGTLREQHEKVLRDFVDSRGELDDKDILHTIRLLMSTPEFQLT